MKVAIVVLNYKGLQDTLECLASLRRLDVGNHRLQIIVVDNGSADGSAQHLATIKDIDFIANRQNLGFSGGNNVGIKKALKDGSDWVLILNNDTFVEKSMLINLIKSSAKAQIISPKIYFAPGFEFHKNRYPPKSLGKVIWYGGGQIDWQNVIGTHTGVDQVDSGQFDREQQVDLATGAAMFIKREVFTKIGFLDEKYFLYLEDMDFCYRAQKAGLVIHFQPRAIVWHKNAGSSGSGSKLQDYYFTRNRLLFAFKYARLRTKIAVLRQITGQIRNQVKRQALFDFLTFKFGQAKIT